MAFYHCVHGKSLFVVVFVGPCPFRFLLCFSAGWRNANLAGGSACRLLFGCFCVLFWVFDLPCYMTTGVHVEFISNCFFTCKDRALERDRPYQKKKKVLELRHLISSQRRLWTLHIYVANIPRYIDPVCLNSAVMHRTCPSGEACPGVLKVSCCGVASRALRNLATSVSMIWICFKVM